MACCICGVLCAWWSVHVWLKLKPVSAILKCTRRRMEIVLDIDEDGILEAHTGAGGRAPPDTSSVMGRRGRSRSRIRLGEEPEREPTAAATASTGGSAPDARSRFGEEPERETTAAATASTGGSAPDARSRFGEEAEREPTAAATASTGGSAPAARSRLGEEPERETAAAATASTGGSAPDARQGPTSLEEVFNWPAVQVPAALSTLDPEGKAELRLLLANLTVTTCYSGIGCVEMILPMLQMGFTRAELLTAGAGIRIFRAMDVDPICRHVLQHHALASQPLHVQGDVSMRAPEKTRRRLDWLRAALLAEYQSRRRANLGQQDLLRAREVLSQKLLHAAKRALSRCVLADTAWCHKHHAYCPCEPVCQPGQFRLEAAGVTCVAWSTMGSGEGWLHQSSIPCLIWLQSLLQTEPDIVLLECVRGLPEADIRAFVAEKFVVEAITTSPVQLGVPAQCHRKYTLMFNRRTLRVRFAYIAEAFARLFHRTCCLEGGVFFHAPESVLGAFIQDNARLRQVCWQDSMAMVDVLPPGHAARARRYEEVFATQERGLGGGGPLAGGSGAASLGGGAPRGLGGGAPSGRGGGDPSGGCHSTAIVDLSQNPERGNMRQRFAHTVPALTKGAWPYCVLRRRLLLPIEMFSVQGVPLQHLLPRQDAEALPACYFPLRKELLDTLGDNQMRHLSGNSMQLSQLGASLLFALVSARPRRTTESNEVTDGR